MPATNTFYDYTLPVAGTEGDLDAVALTSMSRDATTAYVNSVEALIADPEERARRVRATIRTGNAGPATLLNWIHNYATDRDDAAALLTDSSLRYQSSETLALAYLRDAGSLYNTRIDMWGALVDVAETSNDIVFLVELMESPHHHTPAGPAPDDIAYTVADALIARYRSDNTTVRTEARWHAWLYETYIASGIGTPQQTSEVLAEMPRCPEMGSDLDMSATLEFIIEHHHRYGTVSDFNAAVGTLWNVAGHHIYRCIDAISAVAGDTYGSERIDLRPARLNYGGPGLTGDDLIAKAAGNNPPRAKALLTSDADALVINIALYELAANVRTDATEIIDAVTHPDHYHDERNTAARYRAVRDGFRARPDLAPGTAVDVVERLSTNRNDSKAHLDDFATASTDAALTYALWANRQIDGRGALINHLGERGVLTGAVIRHLNSGIVADGATSQRLNQQARDSIGEWLRDHIGVGRFELALQLSGNPTLGEIAEAIAAIDSATP